MRGKALITGITGQGGSYLAGLLLTEGYEVYGVIRRSRSFNTGRLDPIYGEPHVPNPRPRLIYGDLNDASSLNHTIRSIQPDQPEESYNLGAQSHVRVGLNYKRTYTASRPGAIAKSSSIRFRLTW